jgi:LmbE family N-acetylglucosaminyl deacetylase
MTTQPEGAGREVGPAHLDALPRTGAALAIYAHPDDETFGLGAVLGALVHAGTSVGALCFTRGEASTLGGCPDDLGGVRATELAAAAQVLGLGNCEMLAYPDGRLAETPTASLAAHVVRVAQRQGAELLVVFDEGGVTGHADHQQASLAALAAAAELDIGVLAWAVRESVATTLNAELGTDFRGRSAAEVDLTIAADRDRQLRAIACHRSQSTDNPVLRRRLELTGPTEPLRWLRRPTGTGRRDAAGGCH